MKLTEMKLYNHKYINYIIIKDNNFFITMTKKEYEMLKHREKSLLKKNKKLRELIKKGSNLK